MQRKPRRWHRPQLGLRRGCQYARQRRMKESELLVKEKPDSNEILKNKCLEISKNLPLMITPQFPFPTRLTSHQLAIPACQRLSRHFYQMLTLEYRYSAWKKYCMMRLSWANKGPINAKVVVRNLGEFLSGERSKMSRNNSCEGRGERSSLILSRALARSVVRSSLSIASPIWHGEGEGEGEGEGDAGSF